MGLISYVVLIASLVLFAQALFSLYLMLYTWEHPDRLEASRGPTSFLPPRLSFTVLLPARHEEAVIHGTIKRVWAANYPSGLLEIVVVCHASDAGTIAEAQRAIREIGYPRVRVETFSEGPINKPRGLNVGLERTANEVVTIFDAEDDVDPEIFNVINTVMLEEGTGVVQAGVQLMNFRDHWFSVHNCLEYFFYFKSRLHFHAKVGMIPLGGNTVFILRSLLERIGGWDENCLTEDADIGLRLSVLGERIRVVYDAQHVTREETPDSVAAFVKQRTRWHQGFIQILRKGSWLRLRRLDQKLLAFYTLSYSIFQGLVTFLWPLAVLSILLVDVPTPVAMVSFLPLYALFLQLLISIEGAFSFSREYGLKRSLLMPVSMTLSFIPFQFLLGVSAIRAIYRDARSQNNWEKTEHLGAHRRPQVAFPAEYELLLDEVLGHLDAERGSVMVLDPKRSAFSIKVSRGLPAEVVGMGAGEGVASWVAQTGVPVILNKDAKVPEELGPWLRQPELRSSIVMPMGQRNGATTVLSISSKILSLDLDDLRWLGARVGSPSVTAVHAPVSSAIPRKPKPSVGPHGPDGVSGGGVRSRSRERRRARATAAVWMRGLIGVALSLLCAGAILLWSELREGDVSLVLLPAWGDGASEQQVRETGASERVMPTNRSARSEVSKQDRCDDARTRCLMGLAFEVAPRAEYVGGRLDADGLGRDHNVLYFVDPDMEPCERMVLRGAEDEAIMYTVTIAGEASLSDPRKDSGCTSGP